MNRYGSSFFAQVPERVLTKSFVVLILGNSKSFHFGAQGTFNGNPSLFAENEPGNAILTPAICPQRSGALRAGPAGA